MLNFLVWLGVTSNGQILNFQRFFEAIKQILAFQIPFKRIGAALLAAAELFFSGCFKTPITPCGEAPDLTGYSLVFEDDFDGTELNSDVWYNRCEGTRRTGYNADSQATVKDGNLILTGEYRKNGKFGAGWYTGMVALKENYTRVTLKSDANATRITDSGAHSGFRRWEIHTIIIIPTAELKRLK